MVEAESAGVNADGTISPARLPVRARTLESTLLRPVVRLGGRLYHRGERGLSPGRGAAMLEPLPPIDAAKRLREVDEALIVLLRRLGPEDWQKPAVGSWRVRDVVAHLLDGSLRRLSLDRDGHRPPPTDRDLSTYEGLVGFLNELNATWIDAAARLSPAVLIELLAFVDPLVADYLESLDPDGVAAFPVAWAGESESKVWMDVAREYTERWHHQQQIRDAVGAPALDRPRYLKPLLDTCARALPKAYEEISAVDGTSVLVEIGDLEDCAWLLMRRDGRWQLGAPSSEQCADVSIRLPAETTWRSYLRAIDHEVAVEAAEVTGDWRLVEPFFGAAAVMV